MPRGGRRHGGSGAPQPAPERPTPIVIQPVTARVPRRQPCSKCRLTSADHLLIRGLEGGAAFCEPCWREVAEGFADRLTGGEPLNRYYLRTYGITTEQYGEMYLRQRGCCAICGVLPLPNDPLAVDHDHMSGAVRGLLCRGCNVGLGCFKDNIASMGRAIAYLATESRRDQSSA